MNGPIIDCKQAMELLTREDCDQTSLLDRLRLRTHLLYCRACASFQRFQTLLRRYGPELDQPVELDGATQSAMEQRLVHERDMK